MSSDPGKLTATIIAEPWKLDAGVAPRTHPEPRKRTDPQRLDRQVYLPLIRSLLPRWSRIVGPAPWAAGALYSRIGQPQDASLFLRQQAATLAIGIAGELDPQRGDRSYLREVVRASLTRWQLALRDDGRPLDRCLRHSLLHGPIMASVVQLLNETKGFQTPTLLDDLDRHARWLINEPQPSPRIDASTVAAVVDVAVLTSDQDLLVLAKGRLARLLARQDSEGWFPEDGGVSVGRLFSTVDSLAHLYTQTGWGELEKPLQKALRFLLNFVHPDGSIGSDGRVGEATPVSPYGAEVLAKFFPEAAALALASRRSCARLELDRLVGWSDDACALFGAGLALAAANALPQLPAPCPFPYETKTHTRFPRAGVSIFTTEAYHAVVRGTRGGAIRVTWKNSPVDLDDPGLTVLHGHSIRTSGQHDRRTRQQVTESSITCRGILRRIGHAPRSRWSWLKRWLRRTWKRKVQPTPPVLRENQPKNHLGYQRLTHDLYTREITFGDEWIKIRDHVHCRLPCETILCQTVLPGVSTSANGDTLGHAIERPPIFVDGGRDVEITRLYRNGQLITPGEDFKGG